MAVSTAEAILYVLVVLVVAVLAIVCFCTKSVLFWTSQYRKGNLPDLGSLIQHVRGIGADISILDVNPGGKKLSYSGFPRWDVRRCLFPVPAMLGKLVDQQSQNVAADYAYASNGTAESKTQDSGDAIEDMLGLVQGGCLRPSSARSLQWISIEAGSDVRQKLWESFLGVNMNNSETGIVNSGEELNALVAKIYVATVQRVRPSASQSNPAPVEQPSPRLRSQKPGTESLTVEMTVQGTPSRKVDTGSPVPGTPVLDKLTSGNWQAAPSLTPMPFSLPQKKDLIAHDVGRCKFPEYRDGEAAYRLQTVLRVWVARHPGLQYRQCMAVIGAVVVHVFANATKGPLVDASQEAIVDALVRCVLVFERMLDVFLGPYLHPDEAVQHEPSTVSHFWTRVPVHAASEIHLISAFIQVLRYFDPQLAVCLNDVSIDSEVFAVPFLTTLFADNVTLDDAVCLWDVLVSTAPDGRFPLFMAASVVMQTRAYILGPKYGATYARILEETIAVPSSVPRTPVASVDQPVQPHFPANELPVLFLDKTGVRPRNISTTSSQGHHRVPSTLPHASGVSPWFRFLSSTSAYPVDPSSALMLLSKLKEGGLDVNWAEASRLALKMWAWAPENVGQLAVWPRIAGSHAQRQLPLAKPIRLATPPTMHEYAGVFDYEHGPESERKARMPVSLQSASSAESENNEDGDTMHTIPTANSNTHTTATRLTHHGNIIRLATHTFHHQQSLSSSSFLDQQLISAFHADTVRPFPEPLRCLLVGSRAPGIYFALERAEQTSNRALKRGTTVAGLAQPLLGDVEQSSGRTLLEDDSGAPRTLAKRLTYADIMPEVGLTAVIDVMLVSVDDTAHALAFAMRGNLHLQRAINTTDAITSALEHALSNLSLSAIASGSGYAIVDMRSIPQHIHDAWSRKTSVKLVDMIANRLIISAQLALAAVLPKGHHTAVFSTTLDRQRGFLRGLALQVLLQHFRVFHVPIESIIRPEATPPANTNTDLGKVPLADIAAFHQAWTTASAMGDADVQQLAWSMYANICADQSMDRRVITPPTHLATALQGPKAQFPFSTTEYSKNHGISALHRRPFIKVVSAAWPELIDVAGIAVSVFVEGIDPSRVLAIRDVLLRCHLPFLTLLQMV